MQTRSEGSVVRGLCVVQGLQPDVCGQYFYSGRAGSEVCRLWSEGSVVRGLWSKVYSPTSVASTSTLVARYLRSAVCGLRGLWSVVCPRFTTRRLWPILLLWSHGVCGPRSAVCGLRGLWSVVCGPSIYGFTTFVVGAR